jgi:hypothetical protein
MVKIEMEGKVEDTIDLGTMENPRDLGIIQKPQKLSTRLFMQRVLATYTAVGYFTLLAIPFIFLILERINVDETIDLIKTIAAILSGIVGMVWGFYFYKG